MSKELESLFFHVLDKDGFPLKQGKVLRRVEEWVYLVQYFDWFIGGHIIALELVGVEEMLAYADTKARWKFYLSSDDMNRWYEAHKRPEPLVVARLVE